MLYKSLAYAISVVLVTVSASGEDGSGYGDDKGSGYVDGQAAGEKWYECPGKCNGNQIGMGSGYGSGHGDNGSGYGSGHDGGSGYGSGFGSGYQVDKQACFNLCMTTKGCVGIEYEASECELYERIGSVEMPDAGKEAKNVCIAAKKLESAWDNRDPKCVEETTMYKEYEETAGKAAKEKGKEESSASSTGFLVGIVLAVFGIVFQN